MKNTLLISLFCLTSIIAYTQPSFVLNEKIVQSTRHSGDVFGNSVDIFGDYAVVGVKGYDYDENGTNFISGAGAVIIFEKENGVWVEKQLLTDPEGRNVNAEFGYRVAIYGDNIIVGSYRDPLDQSGANSIGNAGSASFYRRDALGNWNFVNTVVSNNRHIDSYFGSSVAIYNNYAIVGDPFENIPSYPGAGAAYIYKYNGTTWSLLDKITAWDITADDEFGIAVDINNNEVVVGAEANGTSSLGTNFMNASGAAYVFKKTTETNWTNSAKLTASDRAAGDNLGFQVSIHDSIILVSSHYDAQDENNANTLIGSGSCYTFKKDAAGQWNQQQKIVAPVRYVNDYFGRSLSMDDSTIVIATEYNSYDENESNFVATSGSAYVYKLNSNGFWVFDQKLVDPVRFSDRFGSSCAIDNNSIIIGAFAEDYDALEQNLVSGSGAAYVYSMCSPTFSSINVTSCPSYTAPDGQVYNSSGTYTAIINNVVGCDSTITINLTIEDLEAPMADNTTLPNVTAECTVTALTAPTATDNCAGTITATHNVTLPITTQGTTVVTWTYNDGNGNTSTQTQNIVIDDVTAPVANVASLSNITSECSVTSLTAPTATDNCAGSIIGTHNVTLPITTQGTTVVTWTYDDGNGNTSTQTQNVVIDDVTAPVANVTSLSNVTSECSVTSLTAPTAIDNCAGTITGTHNATLPITTQGTTVVTWTYDDGNGNTSTQTQNVVIDDVTAPVANVASLSDITSECSVTSLTAPTAIDNCAGTITGTHNATLPITTQGTTVVTWTYDDGNGNTSSQTQDVVITPIDNGITQVDAITLSANASGYSYQWVDCNNGNAPVSGATNQTFTPVTAGSYACLIDNGTCSVMTDCLSSSLSLNEFAKENTFSVFPNPTSGKVNLLLGKEYQNLSVKVFNTLGQTIFDKAFTSVNEISIDIEGEPGIYLLEIVSTNQVLGRVRVIKN